MELTWKFRKFTNTWKLTYLEAVKEITRNIAKSSKMTEHEIQHSKVSMMFN